MRLESIFRHLENLIYLTLGSETQTSTVKLRLRTAPKVKTASVCQSMASCFSAPTTKVKLYLLTLLLQDQSTRLSLMVLGLQTLMLPTSTSTNSLKTKLTAVLDRESSTWTHIHLITSLFTPLSTLPSLMFTKTQWHSWWILQRVGKTPLTVLDSHALLPLTLWCSSSKQLLRALRNPTYKKEHSRLCLTPLEHPRH